MSWRPNAELATLKESAQLRRCVRSWMESEDILEVLTPTLSSSGTTDPNVPSVCTDDHRFLHTSPEFPMKRLLAAYANHAGTKTDIYQIAAVFRAGETGRYHNSEFSLLEWYRVGMDHLSLIDDTIKLLRVVCENFGMSWNSAAVCRYGVEVRSRLGVWPEDATPDIIRNYFSEEQRSYPDAIGDDLDSALDLFIDEFVLPDFPSDRFTFMLDYPASQAALSRLGRDQDDRVVAERFEVYFGAIELANGFHELSDSSQQRARFEADTSKRQVRGLPPIPIDNNLLDALSAGLPDCAGIALGLDRLLMVLRGYEHINQVLSFDDHRA